MWAAVLLPPILRARSTQRSTDTIGSFRHSLSALGSRIGRHGHHHHQPARSPIDSLARLHPTSLTALPTNQPAALRNPEMSPMQRRRRDVLVGLAGAAGVTMLLALFVGSAFAWFLWLLCTAALGGYVYLLLRLKQTRLERTRNVHFLDARRQPAPAAPQLALSRRSGS